jgi:hypothetical protein
MSAEDRAYLDQMFACDLALLETLTGVTLPPDDAVSN